jgi:exonuclease SbcD
VKAFHIADTHIKLGTRWDECRRVLNHFSQRVEEEKPDIVLHAGDVFDARSAPKEMEFAEEWFQRMANVCPVVIVGGNHDDYTELVGFRRLDSKHEIRVAIAPQDMYIAGLHLICIPWPTLSMVMMNQHVLSDAHGDAMDHLRTIFQLFGKNPSSGLPRMALIHAMVSGSKTTAGQPLRNCDFSLGLEDLAFLNCDAIAMGHIHNEQQWKSGVIRYSGSPFHTDWGDFAEKSFSIWEYDHSGIHNVYNEPLPAHQMLDLNTDFHADEGRIVFDNDNEPPSICDVDDVALIEARLNYSFAPEEATAAHVAARRWREDMLRDGYANVKLNPKVVVSSAARIPEVTTAISPEDKLKAYMKSRGEDPYTEDNQRVLEKFRNITEVEHGLGT